MTAMETVFVGTPDVRLTNAFMSGKVHFDNLRSFRRVATEGIKPAKERVYKENFHVLDQLRTEGWRFPNPDAVFNDKFRHQTAMDITQVVITGASRVVDAASLVFAHSVLEAVVYDCLIVSSQVAPDKWLKEIKDRKVSYEMLTAKSLQEIRADLIQSRIDEFVRQKDLPTRIDYLISLCKPVPQLVIYEEKSRI
jgi:hypothetical protein